MLAVAVFYVSGTISMELISTTERKCLWSHTKKDSLKLYEPKPLLETPCLLAGKMDDDIVNIGETKSKEFLNIMKTALPDSALARFR